MSRRQRRKSGDNAKSTKRRLSKAKKIKKGLWWKVLLGLFVVLISSLIIGYFKTKAYLHSDDFREMVSKDVSDILGSEGSFGEFKWDGLSGATTGYAATGEGAIHSVDVENIDLNVDLNFIKRDVFKLKKVKVAKVSGVIDLSKPFLSFKKERERGFLESFLPEEVELYDAEVYDMNAVIKTSGSNYSFENVAASLKRNPKGTGYDINAKGGMVKLPLSIINGAYLDEANLKLRGEEVYLNDSLFTVKGSGKLELNGFADLAKSSSNRYEIKGKLSGLRAKDVFPTDWQKNLKGEVVARFSVNPHRDGLPLIKGHLEIKNGTLEALPILEKISYYLADAKYRTMRFQKFECDFEKYEDRITLRNIVLSSKDLLQIEGNIVFDGREIDGVFDVGLPSGKLSQIPGAETSVFLPGKNRLNWAQVRIGGTIDDIEEDLTDRLLAAARDRIIGEALRMGGDVIKPERIKQATDAAGDAFKILKGDKTLLEGLNGLMGNGPKKTEEKEVTEEDKEKKETEKEDKGILPIPLPVDPRKIPDLLPFL